ncbi:hypothetical protein GDO86_012377 [Hymenochirus boettgeri]|uniref:Protein phosphatase 1 regulatory subunit 15A n=1 Tax=Hymenochirus boettgeri TaxID=247094 RepID=A0A8T2ISG9_9PIPI|nr:hypothetical protein GDO86_012377 [Hymenochirus boettgeri]
MELYFLTLGVYSRNITAPVFCHHKGTAFQLDTVKTNHEMQAVHTEMGTSIFTFTLAAKIIQTAISLVKLLMPKRLWYWKDILTDFLGKAARTVLWICWSMIGHLVLMDNSTSIRYYRKGLNGSHVQPQILEEDEVVKDLDAALMLMQLHSIENLTLKSSCDSQSSMKKKLTVEAILPSCTNPVILSMVYLPSEDDDTSEEPDLHELEIENDMWENKEEPCSTEKMAMDCKWPDDHFWDSALEISKESDDLCTSFFRNEDPYNPLCFSMPTRSPNKEPPVTEVLLSCNNSVALCQPGLPSEKGFASSHLEDPNVNTLKTTDKGMLEDENSENMSTDGGMQNPWAPESKSDTNESDWLDEDSWDSDSEIDNSKENEDLWASFCLNDDPYNPLCFAMPTTSPITTHAPDRRKAITELKASEMKESVKYSVLRGELDADNEVKKKYQIKRFCVDQSSHSPVLLTKPNASESSGDRETGHFKRVRFSPTVTVHPMVVWSYAYRKARKGPWEEYARDHYRFQRRIADAQTAIGFCLEPQHREKIWALQERNME